MIPRIPETALRYANAIRRYRKRRKMTLAELAEAFGWKLNTLGAIERGEVVLSNERLAQIRQYDEQLGEQLAAWRLAETARELGTELGPLRTEERRADLAEARDELIRAKAIIFELEKILGRADAEPATEPENSA